MRSVGLAWMRTIDIIEDGFKANARNVNRANQLACSVRLHERGINSMLDVDGFATPGYLSILHCLCCHAGGNLHLFFGQILNDDAWN